MAQRLDCSVLGCATPATTRGYCVRHYTQWTRTGSPLTKKEQKAALPGRPALRSVPQVFDIASFGDAFARDWGADTRRAALERAAAATPDALEPENAAALDHARRMAGLLDRADELGVSGEPDLELAAAAACAKLNPQYLSALVQCGLTPGARKPIKKAEPEGPALAAVADF